MTNRVLELDDLVRRYGDKLAVSGVSMSVQPGEVIGLAGPNGAGKSSIAKMSAGFMLPSAGRILVDGVAPALFRMRSGIGYLAEEPARIPTWRVRDLFALRRTTGRAELDAARLIELLDVRRVFDQRISTLSKGQLRLACAGYALLGPSKLVILDEPDSGLDPVASEQLVRAIQLAAHAGAAVLVLSHNLELLERLCARIVFILDGRTRGEHVCDGSVGLARTSYTQLARAGDIA
jgi:ABC-2 type transport system ATP-binding protein